MKHVCYLMLMWDFQPVLFRVGGLQGLKSSLSKYLLKKEFEGEGSLTCLLFPFRPLLLLQSQLAD